jgi:hypothetical protein
VSVADGIELEAAGDAQGEVGAGAGMFALLMHRRLADVVQQQRQIQQAGALQFLKDRLVIPVGRLGGLPDFIELFEADERVLIRRVHMIKLVLHEARQPAEFGNVFAEKIHLVHRAQNGGHLAAPVENGQESIAHLRSFKNSRSTSESWLRMSCARSGMQRQMPLLRVEKNPHQPAGRIAENAVVHRADFAGHEHKTVHRLGRLARGGAGQPLRSRSSRLVCGGAQGHALLQRARDEIDVAHVDVEVAHEFLNALAGRAVAVAEVGGDGRLHVFAQHVLGAVGLVMQLRAHAQEKIIGGLQLLALGGAHKLPVLQIRQRPRPVFEERHPQQVLKIAQAAAAVLDVRLLHARGIAVLGPPRRLVFQPHGDVFLLVAGDAFG